MKIVIVGAGKVGVALTRHLAVENRVTVIDQNPHLVENIINIYDVMGVCGNGASYDVQKEADVEQADLLIATTSSDEINILTCLVAKKMGVQHTIARIRSPEYGASRGLCAVSWGCPWPSIRRRQRPVRLPVCCGSPPP